MINLKLKHGNVERYLNQVIEDPKFYMGDENYNKYKDQIDFNGQFIFIETSIIYSSANADITAIPLKDNMYCLIFMNHARGEDGIYTEREVMFLLNKVKEEYERRGYSYYYEGHLL